MDGKEQCVDLKLCSLWVIEIIFLSFRYSVKGLLDELLLKQLVTGKLFVGQKLRVHSQSYSKIKFSCSVTFPLCFTFLSLTINHHLKICGAGLCGWDAPVTPLEVITKLIHDYNFVYTYCKQ